MSRLRNIRGAREAVGESSFVIRNPKEIKGNWKSVFNNENPIHIEIGMGKGRFIMDMASLHPDINYIGLERYDSVLLRALQKMDERISDGMEPKNVRFLCEDAAELPEFFEKNEVDRIYLNFSDPWPKDRHAKRRLPAREFLARYEKFLKPDGTIEFKTDNRQLFDFAVEELEPAGFEADYITYDLHADENLMQGNVMTEYEEKFSSKGNKICKYCIRKI